VLDRVYRNFTKLLEENKEAMDRSYDFESQFQKALQKAEQKLETAKESSKGYEEKSSSNNNATSPATTTVTATSSATIPAPSSSSGEPLSQEEIKRRIMMKRSNSGKKGSSKSLASSSPTKPEKKTGRKWGGVGDAKLSKEEQKGLDMSKGEEEYDESQVGAHRVAEYNLELEVEEEVIEEEEEDEEEAGEGEEKTGKRGFFGNLFRGLTGRTLDKEDLEPVLLNLQEHLIRKNVASDVAVQICSSVQSSLLGKELGSLSSVSKVVREAVRVALVKILTPKRKIDILVDVDIANNKESRPFTIVFVGINGVGKSTNLAKVASWLLSNKKKVLIAACDTFRSGAVEQLGVHCRNLDIPLFQQGYGNDAAAIANYAIKQATKDNQDVVLIDTAGRMQDNERLMQALAKLVAVNRPDLILFVGEALAGNDAVDQLTKFNQALIDFAGTENPRLVDGIIMSKFDTVDDQVGTAVSLVYSSGLPIVFLGTGQHYMDLKKLNVDAVVKALLK
jgi:signal recognition particle receptor subunit alpha